MDKGLFLITNFHSGALFFVFRATEKKKLRDDTRRFCSSPGKVGRSIEVQTTIC